MRQSRYERVSDGDLVVAALNGDALAFEHIFLRYVSRVRAYCVGALGNESAADDVTQETFVRAWRVLDSFDPDRSLWPWLQTIAGRLCVDEHRRAHNRRRIAQRVQLEARADPPVEIVVEEQHPHELDQALATLNPRYRRLLLLHASEGLSYKQLAAAEGSTVTSVAKVLSRAKGTLRTRLRAAPSLIALPATVRALLNRGADDRKTTVATNFMASAMVVVSLAIVGAAHMRTTQPSSRSVHAPAPAEVTLTAVTTSMPGSQRRHGVAGAPGARAILDGPVSITTGPPRGVDPTGGGLRVVVQGPDGKPVWVLQDEHHCASDGTLTPPGSPVEVSC